LDELRGLFGSLFDLAGRALSCSRSRRRRRSPAADLVFRAALIIVLSWMALVCATATLVVAFWDQHPVTVLVVVTLAYGGAAALLASASGRRLPTGQPSVRQHARGIAEGRECFGTKN